MTSFAQNNVPNSCDDHREPVNDSGILATKVLNIQNKRYYFDVKQHDHGRFLKLAETAQSGRKSRLVIPMYIVPEVEKIMSQMSAHLDTLNDFQRKQREQGQRSSENASPQESDQHSGSGDKRQSRRRQDHHDQTEAAEDLKADKIVYGRRHYYFNLKENTRGRYLRLKAIGDIPSTAGSRRRAGPRGMRGRNGNDQQQARAVIIPAAGINDFRKELTAILRNFAVDPENDKVADADRNIAQTGAANDKLPASQRFGSKSFRKVLFVDAGENSRGVYARLTECQGHNRDAVTIPSRHFKKLGEWFMQAAKDCPADDSDEEVTAPTQNVGENGSGDAKREDDATKAQEVPNGKYEEDRDSDIGCYVNSNQPSRRREAASDDDVIDDVM